MNDDDFVVVERHDEHADEVAPALSPEDLDKIRLWLSPTEFESEGSEYRKHLNAHVSGTGDWLFRTEQYENWHSSPDNGILWIKGVPGSGKSVIAANLIETLAKSENAPILFFFSRRIIRSNNDPKQLIRDCLCQILDQSPLLQSRLKQVIDQHPEVEHAPFHELWRALTSVLPTMPKIYLVFDALDELAVEKDMFLESLLHLGQKKPQSIKLAITSRPLPQLERALKGLSVVDLRRVSLKVERDIATYITYRMSIQQQRNLTQDDQSAIKDSLCRKGGGLFLYARLMLDELLQRPSPVQSQLKNLPGCLGEMYADLLHEHSVRSGVGLEFQSLLLSWVTHSSRALRLTELAVLINSHGNRCGLNDSQDAKLMARTSCGPLLEVWEDETVQVIHHSFTEFLLDISRGSVANPKEPTKWFPAFMPSLVHQSLASACVDYLLSGCFDSWSIDDRQTIYKSRGSEEYSNSMVRFPFLQYASKNWLHHAAKCDAFDVELFAKFDRFLRYSSHEFESWKDFWFSRESETPDGFNPLHVAAHSGLTAYTRYLLEGGEFPDRVDSHQRTATAYAAIQGHSETLTALLDFNAKPTTFDSTGLAPIHHAAKGNHAEVLKCLLAAGTDPMLPKSKEDPYHDRSYSWETSTLGKTPMQYACEVGSTDAVLKLLQHLEPQRRDTIRLHWASARGQAKVLSLLMQYPEVAANINQKDERGNTPLYLAACLRHPATVRVLLDHGADVHAKSDDLAKAGDKEIRLSSPLNHEGLTSLHGWANCRRQGRSETQRGVDEMESVAVLLIEAGCDIDPRNDAGETPLFAWTDQISFGREDLDRKGRFVSILLRYGATPGVIDHSGDTPLHKVRGGGINAVVELLVKAGADINAINEKNGATPLIAAAKAQLLDVKVFIDHGADPNRQDLDGNTALHYICKSWCLQRKHLQEWLAFADPKIKNKAGETCVYNLRWGNGGEGRVEAIQLLIEKGLNLESRNVLGRTALLDACERGERHLINGLLRFGADATATDFQNKSCFHLLAKTGVSNEDGGDKDFKAILDVIQSLIQAGAKSNTIDYAGNTPFHDAVRWKYQGRQVELNLKSILKTGGVANQANHRGQTALHMASGLKLDIPYCDDDKSLSRINFLLQQDLAIDVHGRDHEGVMAIHLAASTSEINTLQLTRVGADLQAQTLDGRTPLHFAARAAQSNAIGLLCRLYREQFWTLDQKDANGRTPLHEAASSGNSECVYLLLQSGADPNIRDNQGLTPLHAAAEHQSNIIKLRQQRKYEKLGGWYDLPRGKRRLTRYVDQERAIQGVQSKLSLTISQEEEACMLQDVIRLLLSAGADLAAVDRLEQTAYDVAVMFGCEPAVDTLRPQMQEIPLEINTTPLNSLVDRWYSLRTTHAQDILKNIDTGDIKLHSFLETAIYLKNEGLVRALLAAGADPTTMNAEGLTVMHTVAHWGLTSMMEIMSSHVQDLNALSPPLLHVAAARRLSNIQMVNLLIKLGVNVNALYQERLPERLSTFHMPHDPPPSYAAIHIFALGEQWWHIPALQSLCNAGADFELTDGDGRTALQCALGGSRSIYGGRTGFWWDQTLEVLLNRGADVNALSPDDGSTPLLAALKFKREPKLIRKLLSHGADISLGKQPALFAAIESDDPEATAAILEAGADVNTTYQPKKTKWYNRGPKTETPLLAAACKDGCVVIDSKVAKSRASIMALLFQHGSNPIMELNDGETTVFHEIAYFSGLLEPILKTGVDLEIKDHQGRTPLLAACSRIEPSRCTIEGMYAIHLLVRAGANIHATDHAGSTALHLTAASCFPHAIPLLISHGASVSAINNAGLTPLYYALKHPSLVANLQTIQSLLSASADPLTTGPNGETALHLLAPILMVLSPADGIDAQEVRRSMNDERDYFTELTQLYQRFIDAGCDSNARDKDGNTPLFAYVASVKSRCEVLPDVPPAREDIKRMFDEHDVFAVNERGDTLLHVVAGRKDIHEDYGTSIEDSVTLFTELIERGLDPRKENRRGLSALDVAAACGKEGVLSLFGRQED